MAQILKLRYERSSKDIEKILSSKFSDDLQSLAKIISANAGSTSILTITTALSNFRSSWRNMLRDLRLILIPDENKLSLIHESYSLINRELKRIISYLIRNRMYSEHANLLLFLGDSYALTNYINLDLLFDLNILSKPRNQVINWDKQIQVIAKISGLNNRQDLYLDLFSKYTQYRKKTFIKRTIIYGVMLGYFYGM